MHGVGTLGARRETVAQPDVGERAPHHHFVVAAPCAVGVEVRRRQVESDQVATGRAVGLDGARGRDVVGGDAVAEHREDAGPDDVSHRFGVAAHALEEGGTAM